MYSCFGRRYQYPNQTRLNLNQTVVNLATTCHSRTFLAGLNLPGADLNSEGWPDKFDRIKFEQPKDGLQGVTHGWVE